MVLYSIGHSTRAMEDFAELIRFPGIRRLADIRTVPKSRHVPQFNREALEAALARLGVAYVHFPDLGGLRKPRKDTRNLAWKNKSFRGYADYMETEEFEKGLARLLQEAERGPLAFMCAEAVPWRCHRNLVSDALTARGVAVEHIMGPGKINRHSLTSFAVVREGRVSYPGEDEPQNELWS